MNRYIVLTEDGCCGHKHLKLNRAMKCYNRLDRNRNALLVEMKDSRIDPLWIDHCLLKHTSMREMAEALQA